MDATGSVTTARVRVASPRLRPRTALAAGAAVVATGSAVAALLLGGGAPADLPVGIVDPGPVVGWGLRGARLAALLAAVMAVGSLMVAGGLAPWSASAGPSPWRTARCACALWALSALVGYVLVVCDVAGLPLSGLDPALLVRGRTSPSAAALLATAAATTVVALAAARAASPARARGLVVVCLASALLVPVAGHAGSASDGGLALSGLVVHVAAALVWTGGLVGLLLHMREDPAALATGAARFSRLALVAYVVLTGSGLVAASAALPFRGEGWSVAWASGYAAVLAAKVAVLLVLGAIGVWHRRHTLSRLRAGERGAFVRLAAVELVVMAGAAGLATALARTPVPVPVADVHAAATVAGRPTVALLLTQWRPDALVVVALAVALGAYLRARRRLVSRGGCWPRVRTVAFVTGIALAGLVLCSGVTVYVPLLLSAHLAQLLVVLLVVPALLVLGRPVTLAREAHGLALPAPVRRLLARPWSGAAGACVLLALVHRSALTLWCLESPWWHLLTVTVALLTGLLLMCQLQGEGVASPQARARSRGWLLVVAASLGVLALQLGAGDRLLAGDWFLELRLGWSEPLADQRLAGRLAALAALGCLLPAVGSLLASLRAGSLRAGAQPVAPVPDSGQSEASTLPRRASAGTAP